MSKDVIWQAKLDEVWHCEVSRTSSHTGNLKVQHEGDPLPILDTPVDLSYGAQFGPDMGDVAEWQDMCVAAVDKFEHDQAPG